jgi:pyridinium-3,5-biscarboxylic acid mononucleotide synthase
MDREDAERLLSDVAAGRVPVAEALDALTVGVLGDGHGYADLGFARVDTHRALRTGDPEVVYAAGKTADQVLAIVRRLREAHPTRTVLVTRADEGVREALAGGPDPVDRDDVARCVAVGELPAPAGRVTVVCAGTSDLPVAREVTFTARAFGCAAELIADVGVAGLHRVLAVRPALESAGCVVAVAGMDGVLPSVVGGLIGVPLVAVPTSVGYGASFGGLAALLTMLNSCAPGVAVVNIDNGFGAGVFAARVARVARRAVPTP